MSDVFEDVDFDDWEGGASPLSNIELKRLTNHFNVIHGDEADMFDPPRWLVKPFIVEDTVTALYGEPGTFKSFLTLHFALSLATGRPINGVPVKKMVTVYVAAEGQRAIMLRVAAWKEHYNLNLERNDFLLIPKPINLTNEEEVRFLVQYLLLFEKTHNVKVGLIVIDTLSQCTIGADEQAAQAMSVAVSNMIKLRRDVHCTVVFVHHSGKDIERGMRGSSALKANTDTQICIRRKDKDMRSNIVSERQKDVPCADDTAFELVDVVIPRLVEEGHEVCSSLVVTFDISSNEEINEEEEAKTRQSLLFRVANAMCDGEQLPITTLAKRVFGYKNKVVADKITSLFPVDVELQVFDQNENLICKLKRAGQFGVALGIRRYQ